MLLPLAVYYDYIGGCQMFRFLSFDDGDFIDYNRAHKYEVTDTCMDGAHLIDMPVMHSSLALGHFNPTEIDANGAVINDFTQAVVPIGVAISRQSLAYLVDYKGNILKTTLGTIEDLIDVDKIRVGNTKHRIRIGQSSVFGPNGICAVPTPLVNGLYNTHRESLNALYALQGKSSPVEAGFTVEHIVPNSPIIIIPMGTTMLDLIVQPTKRDSRYDDIHTIICPSVLYDVKCLLPMTKFKIFKAPTRVYNKLLFRCASIEQLVPPDIVFGVYLLDIGAYLQKELVAPIADEYAIRLYNAPNLESVTLHKLKSRSEHIELCLLSTPKLREITIQLEELLENLDVNELGIIHGQGSMMIRELVVYATSPKYQITLPVAVAHFKLIIPSEVTNCTITINHKGIQRFKYINTSSTNKIIFVDSSQDEEGTQVGVQDIELVSRVPNIYSVSGSALCPIL